MLIFKVLHILSMFSAVTIVFGQILVLALAIRRRDIAALAAIHRLTGGMRGALIGTVFFWSGVVFGLLAALTGGIDFFKGWLIAAYVLVAASFLFDGSPIAREMLRIEREAVEAEARQRPAEEVLRRMSSSRALLGVAIPLTIVAAIIVDMVVKPF
jgi:hypothetical protein